MIKLDSRTIRAFVDEELEFFVNARIQKIQQPTRKELIFTVRNNGVAKKLYINVHPDFYHICFMSPENESLRKIVQPKQPPMFCMLLRKHLEGAKITDIRAIQGERIVELIFENYSEFSKMDSLCLTVELMGKHSNVILYDYESKNILGCLHNVGEEKSRERELAGGFLYTYPPRKNKKFIEQTSFDIFFDEIKKTNEKLHIYISENYFDFTRFIAETLCKSTLLNYESSSIYTKENLFELYQKMLNWVSNENYLPCIFDKGQKFILFGNDVECENFETVSGMIDTYFARHYSHYLFSNLVKKLESKLVKEISRHKDLIKKISVSDIDKLKTLNYKKYADLIMANLYHLKGNVLNKVELFDYETEKLVEIELDETMSAVENANRYYRLYNKGKKAEEITENLVAETVEKQRILEDYLYSVYNVDEYDELEFIASELGFENVPVAKKKSDVSGLAVQKCLINGFDVYVGKNNRQNDYLYSKISSPDDLWFHALNVSGSHVLLKVIKGKKVDNETLYECAKLAKEYSNSRNSGKSLVIFTERRFIKRPPNTKSGYVTFKNETEVVVE